MKQTHELMKDVVLNGQERSTRSGDVTGVFRREFIHDMREGLPFPMSKSLAYNAMMGELLWFINGEITLSTLRMRSGLPADAWTIWTNDARRWHSQGSRYDMDGMELSAEDLGKLYGWQWRNFGGDGYFKKGVDQLQNLIDSMKNDQMSRYLIVQAYDPEIVAKQEAALPPCHTGFQVYIDAETGEFDLNWTQRSVDSFLGLPFNIASYGMLMIILGKLTGLRPRFLYGDLKDTHIYLNHLAAVGTQLERPLRPCEAWVELPDFEELDDLKKFTAKDFILHDYRPDSPIKAPLSVG